MPHRVLQINGLQKCAEIATKLLLFIQLMIIGTTFSISGAHSDGAMSIPDSSSFTGSHAHAALGEALLWHYENRQYGPVVFVTDAQHTLLNRVDKATLFALKSLHLMANGASLLIIFCGAILAALHILSTRPHPSPASRLYMPGLYLTIGLQHLVFNAGASLTFGAAPYYFVSPNEQMICICITASLYAATRCVSMSPLVSKTTLLAYASQSGAAMQLAKRLYNTGKNTLDLRCISQVSPQQLSDYDSVLLIASTYGDGAPPDSAIRFVKQLEQTKTLNKAPEFSILALGDRSYTHFCAFGHRLYGLLSQKGARPISPIIEVDKLNMNAVNKWWQTIASHYQWQGRQLDTPTIKSAVLTNRCFNPDQLSRPAHGIEIEQATHQFQAGDLLEVLPRQPTHLCLEKIRACGLDPFEAVTFNNMQAPLVDALCQLTWQDEQAQSGQELVDQLSAISPRVYSIASAPDEKKIRLLVRKHTRDDGSNGLASHYLCNSAPGDIITSAVRTHPSFHLPKRDVPLIMIAAGTGLAPFIGFLHERKARQSTAHNWLFFGEQKHNQDFYFEDDIRRFEQEKYLSKISLAWSRENGGGYISDNLYACQQDIIGLVQKSSAHIYVCGAKRGFGENICAILGEFFGPQPYRKLCEKGIIRTDLY